MNRIQMTCLISLVIFFTCVPSAFTGTVPEEARRHMIRGETAVEMAKTPEDYEQAIKEFQEAARVAPDWAEPYYNLGLVLEKAGKLKEAIISLNKYVQLSPDATDIAKVREFIYKLEYRAEQEITLEDALDIYGSLPDAGKWNLSGETSSVYRSSIKSLRREGNRIAITYVCDINKQNTCVVYAEPDAKTNNLKFQLYFDNWYWPCSGGVKRCNGAMGVLGQYVFEIVSRQKITGNAVESFPKTQYTDAEVSKRRFEYIKK